MFDIPICISSIFQVFCFFFQTCTMQQKRLALMSRADLRLCVIKASRFLRTYVVPRYKHKIFVYHVTFVDLRATISCQRRSLLHKIHQRTRYTQREAEMTLSVLLDGYSPTAHCRNSCLCDSVCLKICSNTLRKPLLHCSHVHNADRHYKMKK